MTNSSNSSDPPNIKRDTTGEVIQTLPGESAPSMSGIQSNSQANQTKQISLILEELQQNKQQVNQIMEWIATIQSKEAKKD